MYAFLLIIHILVAILLTVVILIQRGRGGGLVESFSGVESMFGAKTSQFLTRATTIFATVFLFTSISLAFLAARQSRSLIDERTISTLPEEVAQENQPVESELPLAQEKQEQSPQQRQEQPVQQENIPD